MPSANHQVAGTWCWTSIIGLPQYDAEPLTYTTSEPRHFKYNVNAPHGSEDRTNATRHHNHQSHQITMLDTSYQAATTRCQALHTIVDKKVSVTRAWCQTPFIRLPQHNARYSTYRMSEVYQSVSHRPTMWSNACNKPWSTRRSRKQHTTLSTATMACTWRGRKMQSLTREA